MILINIISCLASVATAVIAGMALYAWKREFIGKKKIELAAEIMEAVYEIQDAFIYARCPAIAQPEIDEAIRWINAEKAKHPENTDVYPKRITYLIPHRRLEEKQEVINKFRTLQNKAYMYWGKDMYAAFVKLTDFNQRIMRASKNLYYGEDTPEYKPLYDLIFCDMKDGQIISDDKVNKEINEIVEEFRRNLEPLYMDKRSEWITA
ncbi:MAG: hypothetical protein J6S80_01975 [Alphaproteobacteria bacterium]|nr:hypothetical protein [Alphaproteobacteria bacterium]